MIWALVHNGKYHGWYEINYEVYQMIKDSVNGIKRFNPGRNKIIILPTITAIIKVK